MVAPHAPDLIFDAGPISKVLPDLVRIAGGDAGRAAKVYEGTDALTADDIAETVAWIVDLPAHMNVNRIELMPTCQGPGSFTVKRR